VKCVRNITDIIDKTIRGAQRENVSLQNFTERWTDILLRDCEALNILSPDVEPKAASHITEQIATIEVFVQKSMPR
jgi:cysteinyl-tRNA synthetase